MLMQLLQSELQFAELKNKVTNKTRAELDKQQREYFLQQQLKASKKNWAATTMTRSKGNAEKSRNKKMAAGCKRNV